MGGPERFPGGGPASRQRPGVGPLVLILPLFSLVLGVLWARHNRSARGGEHASPPAAEARTHVPGWSGALERAGGGTLRVWLTRLHADRERQAFDRDVLRPWSGGREGEPWRLTLAIEGSEHGDDDGLDLTGLMVSGDTILSPCSDPQVEQGPVAALLAIPEEPLGASTGVAVVLWGVEPAGDVKLVLLDGTTVALEPTELDFEFVRQPLSRVARSDDGATPEAAHGEAPR